jgi:hypothetical protein
LTRKGDVSSRASMPMARSTLRRSAKTTVGLLDVKAFWSTAPEWKRKRASWYASSRSLPAGLGRGAAVRLEDTEGSR